MTKTKFKTGYDDDKSNDPTIDCALAEKNGDLSRTVQSEKDNCDINVIVNRFQKTGVLTHTMDKVKAQFGDYSDFPDFHEAQNIIARSNQLFMQLPAQIRSRFSNDAGNFLNFCSDPENTAEAIKLGLATARLTPAEPLPAASSPRAEQIPAKQEIPSKKAPMSLKTSSTED